LVGSQFTRAKERDASLSALLGIAGAIVGSHVAEAMGFLFLGSTATMLLPLPAQSSLARMASNSAHPKTAVNLSAKASDEGI
jgi:hypothetical protein